MRKPPLSIPVLVSLFFRRNQLECGDRWLLTFNATKTKLLSFNRHRDTLLVNGIELPEESSFRLLGLTFGLIYGLEATQSIAWAPFIGPSVSLLLNPSCICTNLPFGHVWSTFGHGLDLLDRVQQRVVSLVGSGLSASPVTQEGC